jgi:hypothetical protein
LQCPVYFAKKLATFYDENALSQRESLRFWLGYIPNSCSNKDLLEKSNRNYLEQYASGWLDGAKNNPLPEPRQQCFFLATKLHPNVLDEVLQEDLSNYEWFRPSVTELIDRIKSQ